MIEKQSFGGVFVGLLIFVINQLKNRVTYDHNKSWFVECLLQRCARRLALLRLLKVSMTVIYFSDTYCHLRHWSKQDVSRNFGDRCDPREQQRQCPKMLLAPWRNAIKTHCQYFIACWGVSRYNLCITTKVERSFSCLSRLKTWLR